MVSPAAATDRDSVAFPCLCPPSTIFAVVNRMKCPKELAVYPCTGHEENDDWRERTFAFLTAGWRAG